MVVLWPDVLGVDPVRDHVHHLLRHAEDVDDLLAHEGRAGDHPVGAVRDPALDAIDVDLGVLVDPALVAAVLGCVDGGHQRRRSASRIGRRRWRQASRARGRCRSSGGLPARHRLRACRGSCARPRRLVQLRGPGRLAPRGAPERRPSPPLAELLAAAGEHVDLDLAVHQPFGELAHGQRASPPSINGGYSQERISTRLLATAESSQVMAPAAVPGAGSGPGSAAAAGICGDPRASSMASAWAVALEWG